MGKEAKERREEHAYEQLQLGQAKTSGGAAPRAGMQGKVACAPMGSGIPEAVPGAGGPRRPVLLPPKKIIIFFWSAPDRTSRDGGLGARSEKEMPAHAAHRLIAERRLADGRIAAEIELVCGCVIRRDVAADRIADLDDGRRFPVGKYPCPRGHTVQRR